VDKMIIGYMGIDQYNQHYMLDKYPRKELLEQTGYNSISNMYISDGKHIGYVLTRRNYNALWVTVYEVHTWEGTDKTTNWHNCTKSI